MNLLKGFHLSEKKMGTHQTHALDMWSTHSQKGWERYALKKEEENDAVKRE